MTVCVLKGSQKRCMADLNPEAAWHLIQNLVLIKMLFSLPARLIRVTYPLTQLLQNGTRDRSDRRNNTK